MFSRSLQPLPAIGLTAVLGLAASAALAAAAFGQDIRLAPNVTRAASYERPQKTQFVTSIPGEVFTTTNFNGGGTGLRLVQGERVQSLAETGNGHWILVGRGGVGVGYVHRSTLCPADLCVPGSGTASPPP